jgi:hypothetical protein
MSSIVEINGEEFIEIKSDGQSGTRGSIDFMTLDKDRRIFAFPEGGGDYYKENDPEQYFEISLLKAEEGKRTGYYEYTIDGLYTLEQFEIFKKNYVIDKAFDIEDSYDQEYKKRLNREIKAMLLTE